MDPAVLLKLFGAEQQWVGPCTIIVAADAGVHTAGTDAVGGGGMRVYAPRVVSGRIPADLACVIAGGAALVVVQQQKVRQATGEETSKLVTTVLGAAHLAGVEFPDATPLTPLGLTPPVIQATTKSQSGTLKRPQIGGPGLPAS
jgi:hypothetical protein